MAKTTADIHVYASGRTFIIVPVVSAPNDTPAEMAPVHSVPLTLGRPTSVRLSRAITSARETAGSITGGTGAPWDGDGGRWWQHHLLAAAVAWQDACVRAWDLDEGNELGRWDDVTSSELAEWLIGLLGTRLDGR